MPKLTVKALAEMLRLPAYEQSRMLYDYKYPRQQPQSFRTPYYQTAISGIRNYFRAGNDPAVLLAAENDAQNIGNETRRKNNIRVLESFRGSAFAARRLTPQPNRRYAASVGNVEVRLSPDLQATENGTLHVLYLNCRNAPIDEETAELIVEIGNWVLEQSGTELGPYQLEVVDLPTGRVHRGKRSRASTIKLLRNNAEVIDTLWASV